MAEVLVTAIALLVMLGVLLEVSKKTMEHAIRLAKALGISEMAIGLLVVSVATSLPELTIAITAAFNRSLDLSFGNVFGANVADLLLVTGVAAILGYGRLEMETSRRLTILLLIVTLVSFPLLVFSGRLLGLMLFLVFPVYSFFMLRQQPAGRPVIHQGGDRELGLFFVFMAGVIVVAKTTVELALQLSSSLGIAETMLGATLISLGTTLPELSVSLAAAKERHLMLALGNSIGSSLVNLSLVLGSGLLIYPFVTTAPAAKLVLLSIIANAVVLFMLVVRKRLEKTEGMILVGCYLAFLGYLLIF